MDTRPHPNSRMVNHAIPDYSASRTIGDSPDSGELRMTAQIIQFRDNQNPRDLAPMHGNIEKRLTKLNHMAAEVFNALTIDTAAAEYSAAEKTCVIIDKKAYRVGSLGILAV